MNEPTEIPVGDTPWPYHAKPGAIFSSKFSNDAFGNGYGKCNVCGYAHGTMENCRRMCVKHGTVGSTGEWCTECRWEENRRVAKERTWGVVVLVGLCLLFGYLRLSR